MAISVVSFSFSRAAQPEARELSFLLSAGFLYHILSPTGLQTPSGVPRTPSAGWWISLPLLVSNSSDLQLTDLQLTGFLSAPSYIIVQSPTQSLEWHVWSSSSGNNCHAIYRSLSSGASIYECTMGFLPCPIFSAKPAYAISSHNCHRNVSLPSGASLWNGMFYQVEGQHITRGRMETIQTTALLISVRILRRLLETWGHLSLSLRWKAISWCWCVKLSRSKNNNANYHQKNTILDTTGCERGSTGNPNWRNGNGGGFWHRNERVWIPFSLLCSLLDLYS